MPPNDPITITRSLTHQQVDLLLDVLALAIDDQQAYLKAIHAEIDYRGDDTGLVDVQDRLQALDDLKKTIEGT